MSPTRDVVGTSHPEVLADLLGDVLAGRRTTAELTAFAAAAPSAEVPALVRFLESAARHDRSGPGARHTRSACREVLTALGTPEALAALSALGEPTTAREHP
ncbi:hypothetical protein OG788_41915 [Streptomyces sp. NBC_00647]|uniref:hypothetical protein n=1 Tax=unclassified Streptomyces TaxID=2593676 RepID=UPI00225256D2|nr:hypothetical protein [Streptomyces sp. NBC_00638]MCX5008321.1 hypothetical protein [Streptomyces sp. NBC_00638]